MAYERRLLIPMALCALLTTQRSFVDSAPVSDKKVTGSNRSTEEDGSVQELENLKHASVLASGKPLVNISQRLNTVVASAGENPIGQIQTQLDLPSMGIHRISQHLVGTDTNVVGQEPHLVTKDLDNQKTLTRLQMDINQDLTNSVNKFNSFSGVDYSPLDMAEYIFWTGDEKGVKLAIEELLQGGLMNHEEAVSFLQEIKINLQYLETHYSQQGLYTSDYTKDGSRNTMEYLKISKPHFDTRNGGISRPRLDFSELSQKIAKKNIISSDDNRDDITQDRHFDSINYKQIIERLRVADFLYTEYSMEEVIYQLSKIMFTQSLTRGSSEAQSALQKFTDFLEKGVEEGHISRALEKKILDVLIAALSDTLGEHPELVSVARVGLGAEGPHLPNRNRLLQNFFEINSLETAAVNAALGTNNVNVKQDPEEDLMPFIYGKYKILQ